MTWYERVSISAQVFLQAASKGVILMVIMDLRRNWAPVICKNML
jgi:hypothetical protein